MSLDWDQAGRLWVVETPEYPGGRTINRNDRMVARWNVQDPRNIQPGDKEDRPARDRISWLEDTDGDGRYDRRHVFADKDHGVAERYGLWVEKLFWGRKYFGVERTTYVIGTDGKIKWIFSKVNPEGHAAEVEAALKSL